MSSSRVLGVVVAIVAFSCVHASKFTGNIGSGQNFAYLGRFATNAGTGSSIPTLSGKFSTQSNGLTLYLYNGLPHSWPAVFGNSSCDCACKTACVQPGKRPPANIRAVACEPIILDPVTGATFAIDITDKYKGGLFWYAAVADCSSTSWSAQYSITFLGPNGGQMPLNQQGLVGLYGVFFTLWVVASGLQLLNARQMVRQQSYHPIVKLLTAVVLSFTTFLLCMLIHYASFESNGVGAPALEVLGRLCDVLFRLQLILLLMLLAKGWTISTHTLTERQPLMIMLAVMATAYLSLALWYVIARESETSTYAYDSVPGVIIALLQVACLLWFLRRVRQSYMRESVPAKCHLYMRLGGMYSAYFLELPMLMLMATTLKPTSRQRSVECMQVIVTSAAVAVLMYNFWPSRAHLYFEIDTSADLQYTGLAAPDQGGEEVVGNVSGGAYVPVGGGSALLETQSREASSSHYDEL